MEEVSDYTGVECTEEMATDALEKNRGDPLFAIFQLTE
jgi:NACalpha-BTF3-like transcription factor